MALYMYDFINGRFHTLTGYLLLETRNHPQITRNRNLLIPPFPRVETIRQSFKYQIVDIWNSIPENLKSIESRKYFKKCLTEYFLDSY